MIERLREIALGYPGAWEDHPWEEDVVKVGKKIFVFLGVPDEQGRHRFFGVKLPESAEMALTFEYVTRTGYGLGFGTPEAGWVAFVAIMLTGGLAAFYAMFVVAPRRIADPDDRGFRWVARFVLFLLSSLLAIAVPGSV